LINKRRAYVAPAELGKNENNAGFDFYTDTAPAELRHRCLAGKGRGRAHPLFWSECRFYAVTQHPSKSPSVPVRFKGRILPKPTRRLNA